jgi:hypothetical protein
MLPSIGSLSSDPIARSPDEWDKGNGQAHDDEHPILNFESQKSEMLDKKLRHSGPQFLSKIGVLAVEIYYFYISNESEQPSAHRIGGGARTIRLR